MSATSASTDRQSSTRLFTRLLLPAQPSFEEKTMKNIALIAAAVLLGTASAATVTGSQTTPLTLKVNNFCQLSGTGGKTSDSFSRTFPTLNLGTVNAITSNTVAPTIVAGVDCNKNTALNVTLPKSITLSNGTNSVLVTTDTWGPTHPLTMAFTSTVRATNAGYGDSYGIYDYHEVTASFKVGGSGTLLNAMWGIPGGTYTGNLVISYDYAE